jgi:hypothetical protein
LFTRDFFIFDRPLQPLDEDIVSPCAPTIHRDGDLSLHQHSREVNGGELRALIGVEDVGLAITSKYVLDASMQKSASIVIDSRHDRTLRLNQSTTARR